MVQFSDVLFMRPAVLGYTDESREQTLDEGGQSDLVIEVLKPPSGTGASFGVQFQIQNGANTGEWCSGSAASQIHLSVCLQLMFASVGQTIRPDRPSLVRLAAEMSSPSEQRQTKWGRRELRCSPYLSPSPLLTCLSQSLWVVRHRSPLMIGAVSHFDQLHSHIKHRPARFIKLQ